MDFFIEYKSVSIILHLIGLALGLGAALLSDYLFFRFLKDLKISKNEFAVMGMLSSVVWTGLFLLIISGFFIYLSDPSGYFASSKFLLKMAIVLAITLNGTLLHFYIKPKLRLIEWDAGLKDKHRRLRQISFAAGSVSFISWISATILGSLPYITISFVEGLIAYFVFIILAVISSQIIEYIFSKYFRAS